MSIFERKLSFKMLYFIKNDHKIILQWSCGSGGDAVKLGTVEHGMLEH